MVSNKECFSMEFFQGWAYSGWVNTNCVHNVDYTWQYYVPTIDEFVGAKKGLSIWCKSNSGLQS